MYNCVGNDGFQFIMRSYTMSNNTNENVIAVSRLVHTLLTKK